MSALIPYEQLESIEIIPGAEVQDRQFFGRKKELANLRERLKNPTTSIIIPGPRRWGKSSFVKEYFRREAAAHHFLYLHLQRCQTMDRFYDYFLDECPAKLAWYSKTKRFVRRGSNRVAGSIKKVEIPGGFGGIETRFLLKNALQQFQEMEILLRKFPKTKTILFLDEISDFLLDIKRTSGSIELPVEFLKWLRSLRQVNNVQMVLTGSVNITWTLKEFKAVDLIGDMAEVRLNPMSTDESLTFLRSLLKSRDINLKGDAIGFCDAKIGNGVHYFIQLLADHIATTVKHGSVIDSGYRIESVYGAFVENDISQFSNYHDRLEKFLTPRQVKAARKVLANCMNAPMDRDDLMAACGDLLADDESQLEYLLQRLRDEGYLVKKGCKSRPL